jgi:endonuclease/exonuclease/phosphatase family metal-dependent hydrolase
MKEYNIMSDHLPVSAKIKKYGRDVSLCTWNIADPKYFSHFYPNANVGFEWITEEQRIYDLKEDINVLLEIHDIVGLQEVPC